MAALKSAELSSAMQVLYLERYYVASNTVPFWFRLVRLKLYAEFLF